ncbi:MAG: hypothetical protein AB7G47_14310 [Mycolicibacterium sp.]|uniref:hypothetical protein n=1 Tax=Mycolicibacterium sp. TaxID=2320850 RepID=UPI003D0E91D5
MAQVLDDTTPQPPAKRRSGSNKRQRDRQLKLNLLPSEEQRLQQLAEQGGFRTVQQYILHRLERDLESAVAAS